MDSTSFEIVLNYGMETFSIKPPSSFLSLLDIAKEKYDLTIVNRLVYYDEGEEVRIANDTDYLNFFDFVDNNSLKVVDVVIKSDENKGKRKKSTSLRKRSNAFKPPITSGASADDDCINDNYDQDYEGDLRNLKYGKEEGRWSNQSFNQNEQKRIYYIKQKKELQREEQMKRNGKVLVQIEEMEDEPKGKNRKRELKAEKFMADEEGSDPPEESKAKGKNFYKTKKK